MKGYLSGIFFLLFFGQAYTMEQSDEGDRMEEGQVVGRKRTLSASAFNWFNEKAEKRIPPIIENNKKEKVISRARMMYLNNPEQYQKLPQLLKQSDVATAYSQQKKLEKELIKKEINKLLINAIAEVGEQQVTQVQGQASSYNKQRIVLLVTSLLAFGVVIVESGILLPLLGTCESS